MWPTKAKQLTGWNFPSWIRCSFEAWATWRCHSARQAAALQRKTRKKPMKEWKLLVSCHGCWFLNGPRTRYFISIPSSNWKIWSPNNWFSIFYLKDLILRGCDGKTRARLWGSFLQAWKINVTDWVRENEKAWPPTAIPCTNLMINHIVIKFKLSRSVIYKHYHGWVLSGLKSFL